ncbi:SH3 domain-containing C40 family peptidase [Exiguobacterium sp. LL15]|uniref:SH3 domain-containing C40 family peptidase n=1 Tax=Exiguobacterium sp. LL15 TaxID=2950547 RepID=UPI00210C1550|nr:SH3 domain-containing C40 family peptidase [Exiguobacterium sp. LL15]MCQ4091500.1 C40 family peptidase [Exiguobacterium sp. LL15]
MKKWTAHVAGLAATLMLSSVLPAPAFAESPPVQPTAETQTVTETTGTAYLKEDAALLQTADSTTVIQQLPAGTTFKTLGTDGDFTRVSWQEGTAYVATNALTQTAPVFQKQATLMSKSPLSLVASPFDPTVVTTLPAYQRIDTYGTFDTFTRLKWNEQYVYVSTTQLEQLPKLVGTRYAKRATSLFVEPKTTSAKTAVTQNQAFETFGTTGTFTRVATKTGYAFVLTTDLADTQVVSHPETGVRYVQQQTTVYATATTKGEVVQSLPVNTSLQTYGVEGSFTRIKRNDEYAYVLTAHLGTLKYYPKTARLYVQRATPIYNAPNASGSIIDQQKTNTLLTIYGKSGVYSRIIFRGVHAYVKTADLGSEKVYTATGTRYAKRNLSVYTSASTKSKMMYSVKRADKLTIYGTSGSYTRLKKGTVYGYVKTSDLVTKKPDLYDVTGQRYVTEDDVVIRSQAKLSGKKIGTLKKGKSITIYGKSGYFTRVKYNNIFGFVDSSRIGLNKPTAKAKKGTTFYVHLDQTPLFSADVAYSRPAAYLKKGTKLIGLKSIDDDFWQVRLASGQTGYVLNPYISTSKPDMKLTQKAINRTKIYTVKQTTSFFSSPTSPKGSGLVEQGKRVYPRHRVGNFYVIQSGWTPVYLPVSAVTITSDKRVIKKNNTRGEKLIQAAVQHIGTPYTWGSQNAVNGGFDCSGLIHYATNKAGKYGGRTNVRGYWYGAFFTNRRTSISSGKRSDIVFFQNTYTDGPSHIGIMLDSEHFIHAGGSQLQINSIYEPRWQEHFLGFKSM